MVMREVFMNELSRFKNRTQAGELLAEQLMRYAGRKDVIVLALPRGGVPVGYAVAHKLGVPLDILLVRKLGLPGQEEFAIGAIASGGSRFLQEDVMAAYRIPDSVINKVTQRETIELERRERLYRADRPALAWKERVLILVDDGLATGSTMKVAVLAARKADPAHIIVAVPVAPQETIDKLEPDVDELICLKTPAPFFAVGAWYEKFDQTSDDDVIRLLNDAA
jgi:putative phosphoribosyl transferase